MPCSFRAAMWAGQLAAGQQAAMHLGVQGLHAAIQHFRNWVTSATSVTGRPSWPAVAQCRRWTAADAQRVRGFGKVNNAGLVGYGKKCVHGHGGVKFEVKLGSSARLPSASSYVLCSKHLSQRQSSLCSTSFLRRVCRFDAQPFEASDWLLSAWLKTTSSTVFSTLFNTMS